MATRARDTALATRASAFFTPAFATFILRLLGHSKQPVNVGTWPVQALALLPMFAAVKKIRTVDARSHGEISAVGNVAANTPEWRARVLKELENRPRGEQAKIVKYVQRWHPKFSTGTMSTTLADDEKPGQKRHSIYIPLINRYLWPDEHPISEPLADVIRRMDPDEQQKLTDFLLSRKK